MGSLQRSRKRIPRQMSFGRPPNHSLVPTRFPPQGERTPASHLRGPRIEVVPVTPQGTLGSPPGLTVRGRLPAVIAALE